MQNQKSADDRKICDTRADCIAVYQSLDPELKKKAVALLRSIVIADGQLDFCRELLAKHGAHEWFFHLNDEEIEKLDPDAKARGFVGMYSPHFRQGMAIRNYLRHNGCGEDEFKVFNLDDIYIDLLEEAIQP